MKTASLLAGCIVLISFIHPLGAAGDTPPKMLGQRMVYDPVGHRIIMFGGSYYSGSYTFYGDTWSLDSASGVWTDLRLSGSIEARFNHPMVYDGDRKEIVVFGGFTASDREGDTWVYDLAANAWTRVYTTTSPSRRSDPGAAYDQKAKKVIIFGGYGLDDEIKGDTWAYDAATRTWTQMNPANSPARRYGGVMVYDTYSERCLLFGGHLKATDGRDLGYENEIWAYDYAADDWEMIQTQGKPPARYWHDLAYDTDRQAIILFGGSGRADNELGDTWMYSCRENAWTRINSANAPAARSQPSLAYDASVKKTVMFGGADFVTSGNFVYYNDVWALDENNQWSQLVADEQTNPPTRPAAGVPGFQPIGIVTGLALASIMLILTRRR